MSESSSQPAGGGSSGVVGSVAMFTIDCTHAAELAAYWSRLLGMTITYQDDHVAMITGGEGPAIGFRRVDNDHPAEWPDTNSDKQFHLNLKVADIPAAEAASKELGAAVPEFQPGGDLGECRPGDQPSYFLLGRVAIVGTHHRNHGPSPGKLLA